MSASGVYYVTTIEIMSTISTLCPTTYYARNNDMYASMNYVLQRHYARINDIMCSNDIMYASMTLCT